MRISDYTYYYFLGIGGIGMSAIARYFNMLGKEIAGYDRTPTPLTSELINEGIEIHFDDNILQIPEHFRFDNQQTLVIYTPAIPPNHTELSYFKENGYTVLKRSEVLGQLFTSKIGIAIAGTHGKTTTSTITAHLLKQSQVGCNAFLGGIARNYHSNLILTEKSDIMVVEADEYDRSFLQLHPSIAIVTSCDADHLDIYGNYEEILKAFDDFILQIKNNGTLIIKKGIRIKPEKYKNIRTYTYSASEKADFNSINIKINGRHQTFDLQTPWNVISDLILPLPGIMNLENAIAAAAAALIAGISPDELRKGLSSFEGVKRRFEFRFQNEYITIIDDYAHHPEEIKACIQTARTVFPEKKITGVFQPHLYSRTRDFAADFATSLSLLDEVVLLDIYPAREKPITGITSKIIFDNITCTSKFLTTKEELLNILKNIKPDVLITMGAGDIDTFIEPIIKILKNIKK